MLPLTDSIQVQTFRYWQVQPGFLGFGLELLKLPSDLIVQNSWRRMASRPVMGTLGGGHGVYAVCMYKWLRYGRLKLQRFALCPCLKTTLVLPRVRNSRRTGLVYGKSANYVNALTSSSPCKCTDDSGVRLMDEHNLPNFE